MKPLRLRLGGHEVGYHIIVDVDGMYPMAADEALDLIPVLRAAPDLLEALEELADLWEANKPHWAMPWPRGQAALDAARVAITKARGES